MTMAHGSDYTNTLTIGLPSNSAGGLTWNIPASDGTNHYVLTTDGASPANLSWASMIINGMGLQTAANFNIDGSGEVGANFECATLTATTVAALNAADYTIPFVDHGGNFSVPSLSDGMLPIGDGTHGDLLWSHLTAGPGVTIENGHHAIVISATIDSTTHPGAMYGSGGTLAPASTIFFNPNCGSLTAGALVAKLNIVVTHACTIRNFYAILDLPPGMFDNVSTAIYRNGTFTGLGFVITGGTIVNGSNTMTTVSCSAGDYISVWISTSPTCASTQIAWGFEAD